MNRRCVIRLWSQPAECCGGALGFTLGSVYWEFFGRPGKLRRAPGGRPRLSADLVVSAAKVRFARQTPSCLLQQASSIVKFALAADPACDNLRPAMATGLRKPCGGERRSQRSSCPLGKEPT